jgi:6-phosphogluconolactonase (cycloisomerase 2 family)
MKFSKLSQLFLVSSIGLLVATLLTACQIVTIDFIYVACAGALGTSGDGQIQTFATDSQSGALRTAFTTVSSGGVGPVSMAVTSNYANLYVANAGSSSIAHFVIALNGSLTVKDTVTLSSEGSTPVAIAVNTAGTYLYVTSADYPGPNGPLPGAVLAVFPLATDGTIGTPLVNAATGASYWPLTVPGYSSDLIVPTAITVLANTPTVTGNGIYVAAYDQSVYNPGGSIKTGDNANPGWVFGFTAGSNGALTAITNSPFEAGVKPSGIAADPTDRFVYVTDYANNQLIAFTILGSSSTLSYLRNGPFKTGNEPSALTIDPTGQFIYVTNALDSTVSSYEITQATGTPTVSVNASGSSNNSTDTEPLAVVVDPALGRFVFTANHLGNSISGFFLNQTSGALVHPTEATPYITDENPVTLVAIPHGNHATQSVTP